MALSRPLAAARQAISSRPLYHHSHPWLPHYLFLFNRHSSLHLIQQLPRPLQHRKHNGYTTNTSNLSIGKPNHHPQPPAIQPSRRCNPSHRSVGQPILYIFPVSLTILSPTTYRPHHLSRRSTYFLTADLRSIHAL